MSGEVAGSALQGAAAGSMYGPWGAGIGAVIGGIGGLWNKGKTEKERAELLRQLAAAKKRDLKLSEKMKRNIGIEQQKIISQGLRDLADRRGGQTTRNAYGVARQGYDYVAGTMRQEQADLREREMEINRRYDQFIDPEGRAEQRGEAVGNAITALGGIGAGLKEYYNPDEETVGDGGGGDGGGGDETGQAGSWKDTALGAMGSLDWSKAKKTTGKGTAPKARKILKAQKKARTVAAIQGRAPIGAPKRTGGVTSNVPKQGLRKLVRGQLYEFSNGVWRIATAGFLR